VAVDASHGGCDDPVARLDVVDGRVAAPSSVFHVLAFGAGPMPIAGFPFRAV